MPYWHFHKTERVAVFLPNDASGLLSKSTTVIKNETQKFEGLDTKTKAIGMFNGGTILCENVSNDCAEEKVLMLLFDNRLHDTHGNRVSSWKWKANNFELEEGDLLFFVQLGIVRFTKTEQFQLVRKVKSTGEITTDESEVKNVIWSTGNEEARIIRQLLPNSVIYAGLVGGETFLNLLGLVLQPPVMLDTESEKTDFIQKTVGMESTASLKKDIFIRIATCVKKSKFLAKKENESQKNSAVTNDKLGYMAFVDIFFNSKEKSVNITCGHDLKSDHIKKPFGYIHCVGDFKIKKYRNVVSYKDLDLVVFSHETAVILLPGSFITQKLDDDSFYANPEDVWNANSSPTMECEYTDKSSNIVKEGFSGLDFDYMSDTTPGWTRNRISARWKNLKAFDNLKFFRSIDKKGRHTTNLSDPTVNAFYYDFEKHVSSQAFEYRIKEINGYTPSVGTEERIEYEELLREKARIILEQQQETAANKNSGSAPDLENTPTQIENKDIEGLAGTLKEPPGAPETEQPPSFSTTANENQEKPLESGNDDQRLHPLATEKDAQGGNGSAVDLEDKKDDGTDPSIEKEQSKESEKKISATSENTPNLKSDLTTADSDAKTSNEQPNLAGNAIEAGADAQNEDLLKIDSGEATTSTMTTTTATTTKTAIPTDILKETLIEEAPINNPEIVNGSDKLATSVTDTLDRTTVDERTNGPEGDSGSPALDEESAVQKSDEADAAPASSPEEDGEYLAGEDSEMGSEKPLYEDNYGEDSPDDYIEEDDPVSMEETNWVDGTSSSYGWLEIVIISGLSLVAVVAMAATTASLLYRKRERKRVAERAKGQEQPTYTF